MMNTIVYITLLKNQHRIKRNNADAGPLSDNSTDPVVNRDPNNYLAPIAGGSIIHILIIVVMVLAAFALVVYLSKQLKTAQP